MKSVVKYLEAGFDVTSSCMDFTIINMKGCRELALCGIWGNFEQAIALTSVRGLVDRFSLPRARGYLHLRLWIS